MTTIIIKNVIGGNLEIGDLGLVVTSEPLNLTDLYEITEIVSSRDLRNLVSSNSIIVNDGEVDLAPLQGLKHICLETEHEDQENAVSQRALQLRRSTDFPITSVYQSIPFDTLDFQNDSALWGWNEEDVIVLESGLYCIDYSIKAQPNSTPCKVYGRLLCNSSEIEGSENYGRFYSQEIHAVERKVYLGLYAGDVIKLQIRSEAYATAIADTLLTMIKLEGVKGTDGKDGKDGEKGGAVWLFGTGPPQLEGYPSYCYMDSASGDVYSYIGTEYYYALVSRENDQEETVADAIKLVGPSSQEIILTTTDPTFITQGEWFKAGDPFSYNNNALYSVKESSTAKYQFKVDQSGIWKIYAWWTPGNNALSAPYTIAYEGNETVSRLNQSINYGKWNYIGEYNFITDVGWELKGNVRGPVGEKGESFKIDTYGDLDDDIIAVISAYPATVNDVYVYAVHSDLRTTKPFLDIDLSSHIIAYDGTNWLDYGPLTTIQGPKGDKGEQGIQGLQGPQGIPGESGSRVTAITQIYDSSDGQNVNSSTPVTIEFASIDYIDTDYYSLIGQTGLSVSYAGLYRIVYSLSIKDLKNKTIRARIRKNGYDYIDRSTVYFSNVNNDPSSNGVSFFLQLLENDYIEIFCDRIGGSGSAYTVKNASFLLMEFIR